MRRGPVKRGKPARAEPYHPYIQPEFSDKPPVCDTCGKSATDPVHNPLPADWQTIDTAPEGQKVETKIHDELGVRNQWTLVLRDGRWFFPDGNMYVYYTPTHWRPVMPKAASHG